MWQALLLSQTQLTQGLGHLTVSPSLTMKVADILTSFLPPKTLSPDNPTPAKPSPGTSAFTSSPVKRSQANPVVWLKLVLKLWGVVKNVLANTCLSNIAERVLDAVLAKEYSISEDNKLRDAWSALCSDLVTSNFAYAVTLILRPPPSSNGNDESKLTIVRRNTGREIWQIAAVSWQSSASGVSWETGLQLLMHARG